MDEALIKEFHKRLRERCARVGEDGTCITCGLNDCFCGDIAIYRSGADIRNAVYALFRDGRKDVTDAMIAFNARLSMECNRVRGINIACLMCGLRPFCKTTPSKLTDELIDAVFECLKQRKAARNGEVR